MNLYVHPMLLLFAITGVAGGSAAAQDVYTLETDSFSLGIAANGAVATLIDRTSGHDYCDQTAGAAFASIRIGENVVRATAARYSEGRLEIAFDDAAGTAVFQVVPEHRRLVFEVVSISPETVEELVFAPIPLTLKGDIQEPFGVSPLALNLLTNCQQIPGFSPGLTGFTACKRFGIVGARGAVVACPAQELRDALKDAVLSAPELPHSTLGGPWALDGEMNHGSYLIAMESVTEENVAQWISVAQSLGATQVDLHGGRAFRWGDYEVNREIYPGGRDSLKRVVDAIHEAGLAAGLHTYAFFIAKDTPWVSPVPDPRLDSRAVFNLAADLPEDETTITVEESTAGISPITGFQVRNSATLWIDDELIVFGAVETEPPYGFRGCVRGAHGTRPARHAKGAEVRQLKECFGLFVPRGDSTLFTDVAQCTADLYNGCGFDMLYLDALDGSDIVGGGLHAWHYSSKFVYELFRRLHKPPVLEMSTFSHHLWCVRSRMGAWDCPMRGAKHFVDFHVLSNRQWAAAFLPTHLGWWGVFEWNGIQPERSFPDDFEYVCAKALATNSSLSYIVGFVPETLERENARRFAAIAKRYEELRRAGAIPESIKTRLAKLRAEFSLDQRDDGQWRFRPAAYSRQQVSRNTEPFVFTNPHGAQPLKIRIEALLNADAYDSPNSEVLADMVHASEFGGAETQPGVTAALEAVPGTPGVVLTARNTDVDSGRAWAVFRKDFAAPVNLAGKGLGLWVDGDGQGEVLNVQVRSPQHLAGGLADHYIPIDFIGRRYVELIEPESANLTAYEWAHTHRWTEWQNKSGAHAPLLYPMYHIWVDYAQIETLTLGVNNVPRGTSIRLGVEPIKALPLRTTKLLNPAITIGGSRLMFPVALESGCYIEFVARDNCKVYDAHGERIAELVPEGNIPALQEGENRCLFEHAGEPARAQITFMTHDEPLCP